MSSPPLTFIEVAARRARTDALEVMLGRGRTVRVPVGFDTPTFERLLGILERTA